jgi:HEPN domain-containing protein
MGTEESFSWFEYAFHDLDAAVILSQQLKPKFEIVCYHCQQCAEKMLKGFIASHNGKLLKTHDLVVLCEECKSYEPEFDTILEICSDLTIYASEIRYPNTLAIDKFHMLKALDNAKLIMSFVQNKLNLSLPD